jgi:hypothetical protein
MSDLKNELIRLGSEQSELRKHIRPVLDKLASKPYSRGESVLFKHQDKGNWEEGSVTEVQERVGEYHVFIASQTGRIT